MKTEVQPRDDNQVNLTVELDSESVKKFLVRASREISKSTRIPGFRPGKAPYDVVKRTFGEKQIEEKAIELILDEVYPEALEKENLEPSGPGNIEEIPTLDPAVIKFIVPLKPEITLPDYRSIRKNYEEPELKEERITHILKQLQVEHAVSEPVQDRPAQENDRVYLKLNGKFTAGEEEDDLVKDQTLQVIISDDVDPEDSSWPYPEFSKELAGMSIDEEKTVIHSYPDDSNYERLRGKEVSFTFQVQGINALVLPELNDEFAQSISAEFETLDALTTAIRNQVTDSMKKEYEQEYMSSLIQEIVDGSAVKYPPHLLAEEIKHTQQSLEQNLARQRMDLDTYLKTINVDKETFLAKEITPAAKDSLARSLVLQKIISEENIQVSQAELQAAVNTTIQMLSYQANMPKLPKGMTNQDYVQATALQTASRILNDRLMRRIKNIATGSMDKQADETQEPVEEQVPPAEVEEVPQSETVKITEPVDVKTENDSPTSDE